MRHGCEMDILDGTNGTAKTSYFGTSTNFRTGEGSLSRVSPPKRPAYKPSLRDSCVLRRPVLQVQGKKARKSTESSAWVSCVAICGRTIRDGEIMLDYEYKQRGTAFIRDVRPTI